MMKNCDPRIESYMEAVETGAVRSSKEIKALVKHVRECFETEDQREGMKAFLEKRKVEEFHNR